MTDRQTPWQTPPQMPPQTPTKRAFVALRYLYTRTLWNRLRAQAARVRSPRYLAAVVIGALYLWWALLRNTHTSEFSVNRLITNDVTIVLVSAFLLFSSARWWLFGSDRSALAFTAAEVQFLFPAPITRRGLVHAKLVRMQLAILLNTLIFTVILRGNAGSLAAWERALALWILFTTLAFHRLAASIVRASVIEHGPAGRRRGLIPIVVFVALIGAVAWGVIDSWPMLRAASVHGARATFDVFVGTLNAPVPSLALWPIRTLLAPIGLANGSGWGLAILWSAGILLLHYFWLLRLDGAFEEAALEATQHRVERMQRFRSSQMGQARSRTGKLTRVPPLALTGRPEVAIAWKNVAAALRGGAWRTQLVAFTVGLAALAFASRSASDRIGDAFVGVTIGWGAMLLFLGPLWMRFDLRLDLPRLAMLKTMPLPGWRIVMAEIAAVTLLHSITVWSLMIVPLVMFLQEPSLLLDSGATIPLLVSIVVAVPVFNALMFTVQNGTALLFPAWVRLGTEARGFETMGQNLLTTGATTLVAAIALVFPVGLGVLMVWLTDDWNGWSVLGATVLGGLLLLAELWPVLHWLGSVFERTDVNDVVSAT
ncbi:putative ABC exporter domain-containing protein [Gemmatimonas aurantiaca]|uniref:putative ABC exporter domain-containing protein n=1 Tax=Gemmatimonas aurantiaca TaxID=173480 RepID=UPI00301E024F